jgi:hypothetical protein
MIQTQLFYYKNNKTFKNVMQVPLITLSPDLQKYVKESQLYIMKIILSWNPTEALKFLRGLLISLSPPCGTTAIFGSKEYIF